MWIAKHKHYDIEYVLRKIKLADDYCIAEFYSEHVSVGWVAGLFYAHQYHFRRMTKPEQIYFRLMRELPCG